MNTFDNMPYSNQFERGKSFNWAGQWATNTHYFNNKYVTDFVAHKNCIFACKKDHLSSVAPEVVIYDGKASATKSMYWDFVIDLGTSNPYDITDMKYDEGTGILSIYYGDNHKSEIPLNLRLTDSSIHIGTTPPASDEKIWIDTTEEPQHIVKNNPDIIASLQRAVYSLQQQVSKLMLIRTNGVISGKLTDGTLTEIANANEAVVPKEIEED